MHNDYKFREELMTMSCLICHIDHSQDSCHVTLLT